MGGNHCVGSVEPGERPEVVIEEAGPLDIWGALERSEQPCHDFSVNCFMPRVEGAVSQSQRPHWGARLCSDQIRGDWAQTICDRGKASQRAGVSLEEAASELHL